MTTTNILTAMYVSFYKERPETLVHIIHSSASKMIMLQTYRNFIKEGILQPVETISIFDKIKIVDECRTTKLPFNNQSLTDAAKILHTIKFINENS